MGNIIRSILIWVVFPIMILSPLWELERLTIDEKGVVTSIFLTFYVMSWGIIHNIRKACEENISNKNK